MLYIIINILWYLKDIVMQIRSPDRTKLNPQVDMYLLSLEEQSLENHPNRLVLLALQWNLNLSHWIKLVKKQNSSEISWKIFLIGLNQWHQYVYTVIAKRQ